MFNSKSIRFLFVSLGVLIILFGMGVVVDIQEVLASTPIVQEKGLEAGIGSSYAGFLETADSAGYANAERGLIYGYVGTIVQYVIATLGIIIFILIIYAGFRWMTAQGNSEQVDEAKAWLRNGVIGLLLVMMAYGIALFIVNRLGGAAGIIGAQG